MILAHEAGQQCCLRDHDYDGRCDRHKCVCTCGYAVPLGSDGWHTYNPVKKTCEAYAEYEVKMPDLGDDD